MPWQNNCATVEKKIMKKAWILASTAAILWSCGGAGDGDAKTDTTTMPVDTNVYHSDTNHINSAEGPRKADSTGKDTVLLPQ